MAPKDFLLGSVIACVVLTRGTVALPSPERRDGPQAVSSVEDLTQQAIESYLSSVHVVAGTAVHFSNGWQPIDFTGNTATSQFANNQLLFDKCDKLPSIADNSTESFSGQYTNFIQELNKVVPQPSAQNNTLIKEALTNSTMKCGNEHAALSDSLKYYMSAVDMANPPPNGSFDTGLLQWASQNWPPYQEANTECMEAKNAYQRVSDEILGDNGAIFGQARIIVDAFTGATESNQPGLNMQVEEPPAGATSGATGNYVPFYAVPLLNGTIEAWKASADGPPSFTWSSRDARSSNDTSTSSGSGGLSFVWDDVSGSGSGSGSTTTTNFTQQASDFSLTFGGIALVDIDFGSWFDGYRLASAAHNPPPNDTISAKTQSVFDGFFGNSSKPLGISRYNSQMVVGFRPTWNMTLTDSNEYSQLKQTQGGAKACFLFICAGGSGATSHNVTNTHDDTKSIMFQDLSDNAYILGFVMTSFWNAN